MRERISPNESFEFSIVIESKNINIYISNVCSSLTTSSSYILSACVFVSSVHNSLSFVLSLSFSNSYMCNIFIFNEIKSYVFLLSFYFRFLLITLTYNSNFENRMKLFGNVYHIVPCMCVFEHD